MSDGITFEAEMRLLSLRANVDTSAASGAKLAETECLLERDGPAK